MKEILPDICIETVRCDLKNMSSVNMVIVRGGERSLLVDAGIPPIVSDVSRTALEAALRELGLEPDRLDCVITHLHGDHLGLIPYLHEHGARVFMNPEEAERRLDVVCHRLSYPRERKAFYRAMGCECREDSGEYRLLCSQADECYSFYPDELHFDFLPVRAGEVLEYGRYRLRAVGLKGHTFGQIGLYDEDGRVLFCADQVIPGVVPIVGSSSETDSYLGLYLDSLEELRSRYEGVLFVPGHGKCFVNDGSEIGNILNAYRERLAAVREILRQAGSPMTVREVSGAVYGPQFSVISGNNYQDVMLMWYKTCACLRYLEETGSVREEKKEGIIYWVADPGKEFYDQDRAGV